MRWTRFYTQAGQDFCTDGRFRSVVHENQHTYIVPKHWNQAAADILQEKVFYPEVLPAMLRRVEEAEVPAWLWRSEADNTTLDSVSAEWRFHIEKDIRDVLHRMAGALTYQGWKNKLFTTEDDAKNFYDELRYILLHQIAAPELKQWQLLGLNWAYGVNASYAPQQRTIAFTEDTAHVMRRIRMLGEALALENAEVKTNVILPVENSSSLDFINWKRNRDVRQAAETLGQRVMQTAALHVMDACDRDDPESGFDSDSNPLLYRAVESARQAGLTEAAIRMAISYAAQGYEEISLTLPTEEKTAEDCIETTVSVPDDFIESALTNHGFNHKPAQKMWDNLAEAVWSSGDPGIYFQTSADATEFTDSPAPAATINLLACTDTAALQHTVRVLVTALDLLTATDYRPLQLGLANMAALLMSKGLAYDSDAGRATASLITGFISGAAYHASAEMAAETGAFPAYEAISKTYLQNIRNKMAMLAGTAFLQKGNMRRPAQLRPALCPDASLIEAVNQIWNKAYQTGKETGFRHARVTGIDGGWTAQALLGAQTQDIMPVTTQLHGKNLNPLVPPALKALGFNAAESNDIYFYAAGHGTLLDAPHINHKTLRAKGFAQAMLDAVEAAMGTALHIRYVFNKWTLGEDFCEHMLGFSAEDIADSAFDMLPALGFTEEQIAAANTYCCGTMTLAGAPHLKPSQLAVFDCNVSPAAQIKMQAAVEPFLSGTVAHTVRLDYAVTIDDVQKLILFAWEQGVKNLRLYRDNGSLLHALAPQSARQKTADENIEEYQAHLGKISA
jgi:ribonucleoside-diphosphate reductase alpha chain